MDADYVDDRVLPAKTPTKAESKQYRLKQEGWAIVLHGITKKNGGRVSNENEPSQLKMPVHWN